MNQDPNAGWNPGVHEQQEDSSLAFFEQLGDLDFDLSNFDTEAGSGEDAAYLSHQALQGQDGGASGGVEMDLTEDGSGALDPFKNVHGSSESLMSSHSGHQRMTANQQQAAHARQKHVQQDRYQAQWQKARQGRDGHSLPFDLNQSRIPPTPNSQEIRGANHAAMASTHQDRAYYETYLRRTNDAMIFTPLVSPAVVPSDSQYPAQDYAVPGEYYLTPITSPAIQAQSHHIHPRSVYGSVRESDTSEAASPVDMEVDPSIGAPGHSSEPKRAAGRRKSNAKSSGKPHGRAVKSSPAMKPRSKRLSTQLTKEAAAQVIDSLSEASYNPQAHSQHLHHLTPSGLPVASSQNTSESGGSISPEPLTDILMPPPATSGPARSESGDHQSPQIRAQDSSEKRTSSARGADGQPATPASLMKMQKNFTKGFPASAHSSSSNSRLIGKANAAGLETLRIPRSTDGGPAVASSQQHDGATVDTPMGDDGQHTPTLSAQRSRTQPSTPVVPPSPAVSVASAAGGSKRSGGRPRKNSSHASPSLLPKISPSIQPLLPEGAQKLTSSHQAMLLASRSNYQNLIDGTHMPGVSYPDALSENLTSRRTNHRLAEQGRRDRMNNALNEIAALLPAAMLASPAIAAAGGGGGSSGNGNNSSGGGGGAGAKRSNSKDDKSGAGSKAVRVEMAIEYIKALQAELVDVRRRLSVAEGRLGEGQEQGAEKPGVDAKAGEKAAGGGEGKGSSDAEALDDGKEAGAET